jgi:two-component system nitrate/nitrite response regulator NarL
MTGLGPDVLLFDLSLFRPEGVEALPALLKLSPTTRVVLLTGHANDREGITALKAGVRGYCHREIASSLVGKVLDVVLKGDVWVGRMLVPRLMEELRSLTEREVAGPHGDPDGRLERLTRREREIARLVGDGASNKEIAKQLSISDRTVKAHITTIFQKLGFSDRLRLALFIANDGPRGVRT